MANTTSVARVIAFYLPQFHPIPENDTWWGAGYTEWTAVTRARSLFKGHRQPHLPADLGYYDLRLAEARAAQAEVARRYGVFGFCYYHYWFNGRRLLGRPVDDVLASGQPDYPFCLCWANEDWTRAWDGRTSETLVQQTYSEEDDQAHGEWLASVFSDPRYIRIEGRPLLLIYRANKLPDAASTTARLREVAARRGLGDLYLARVESFTDERGDPRPLGFDVAVEFQPDWTALGAPMRRTRLWKSMRTLAVSERAYGLHRVYDYGDVVQRMVRRQPVEYPRFPCVMPRWDNSPRREVDAIIMRGATPELYGEWLAHVLKSVALRASSERFVFINAWNEWGEGNHLEPDTTWGTGFLEATASALRSPCSG
jgi:lipopolysaccharide biosynthesis protein